MIGQSVAMHSSSHSVTLHVRCKYITLATFGKIHRIWHSDALSIKSSLISLISLLGQAKDRVVRDVGGNKSHQDSTFSHRDTRD